MILFLIKVGVIAGLSMIIYPISTMSIQIRERKITSINKFFN